MKIISGILKAAAGFACRIILAVIVSDVILNPQNPYWQPTTPELAKWFALCLFGAVILSFILNKVKKGYIAVCMVCFVFIVIFQAICISEFSVKYSGAAWDMNVVYSAANYYVENHQPGREFYDYFLLFPNNSALYNILIFVLSAMKAVGVENSFLALNILNTVLIDISVLLCCKTAGIIAGKPAMSFACILCMFLCPFSFYSVIAYTDTFSMPFLARAAYFYAKGWKSDGRARYIYIISAAALSALGGTVKVTVLIVTLAFAISRLIFGIKHKDIAGMSVFALAVRAAVFLPVKSAAENSPFLPEYDYNYSIPYTHWVMMGLNGLGGYCDEDYQNITLKYPDKSSRQRANIQQIKYRIGEKGFAGMIQHVMDKRSFIFTDGTLGSMYNLDRGPLKVSPLHKYVIYCGDEYRPLGRFSAGTMLTVLFLCFVCALFAPFEKDGLRLMGVMCLAGITVFLLLWEARGRYVLNFLPIFAMCAAIGQSRIFNAVSMIKKDV